MSEEQTKYAVSGSLERIVLLRLVAKWRENQKRILDCAKSNKDRGDHNADHQLRAQAFGVGICADELEALVQENESS